MIEITRKIFRHKKENINYGPLKGQAVRLGKKNRTDKERKLIALVGVEMMQKENISLTEASEKLGIAQGILSRYIRMFYTVTTVTRYELKKEV